VSQTSRPFRGLGWRCLSVRQPWAWALVNGFKPYENRDWRPQDNYRGPVVIHASKTLGCDPSAFEAECEQVAELCELDGLLPDVTVEAGGLVGLVNVTNYVTHSPSPWFSGPVGWVCEAAEAWPFMPWRGQRGLWELTIDEQEAICRQLEACGL
jgi:hypothetical protein